MYRFLLRFQQYFWCAHFISLPVLMDFCSCSVSCLGPCNSFSIFIYLFIFCFCIPFVCDLVWLIALSFCVHKICEINADALRIDNKQTWLQNMLFGIQKYSQIKQLKNISDLISSRNIILRGCNSLQLPTFSVHGIFEVFVVMLSEIVIVMIFNLEPLTRDTANEFSLSKFKSQLHKNSSHK